MRKTKEVLRLRFELGLGQRQIARSCGMGLGTVHDYLERAVAAGIGWPLPGGWSEEELEAKLFGNQPVAARAVLQRPQPDWKGIHEQLLQHRHLTLQLLWEEYRQANPEGYRYSWFCERYQRWRRFDTMAMGIATDGLNRLFSNQSDVLRLVRDVGLGLVDRLPALKHLFIREAAGLVGEVPKLLRGEAL